MNEMKSFEEKLEYLEDKPEKMKFALEEMHEHHPEVTEKYVNLAITGKHLTRECLEKAINGMDKPTKHRIRSAIEAIPNGDIKPLKGLSGSYRLRVGDWRIIFSYPEKDTVLIEKIAPRGEVYKGV